jgi:splicing factor 3B subunit 4
MLLINSVGCHIVNFLVVRYCKHIKISFFFLFKIMRDPETGNSRGFGFVSYDSFESSDQAIEVMPFSQHCSIFWLIVILPYVSSITFAIISQAMNNQHLCNRPITVSYAYKKDTKGERHGTPAGIVF